MISLFGSAVNPHKWQLLLDSLKNNKEKYEVVFAGYLDEEIYAPFLLNNQELKYIKTENIKPSQCAEIARRECTGDLICWIDDDYIFSDGFIDKSVTIPQRYNEVIACNSIEKDSDATIYDHRFYSRNMNTPQMAPVGIMYNSYLDSIGGIDARYINGQWENDICMRVWADGGKVTINKDLIVNVDYKNKNGKYNNFWSGWNEDSELLENSWVIGGYKRFSDPLLSFTKDKQPFWHIPISNQEVTLKRNDKFVPFIDRDILTHSQNHRGQWI